jgi:hypothetical protein
LLISKSAHSDAIKNWLSDEGNPGYRRRAFNELSEIVGELYSSNIYVSFTKSMNRYLIDADVNMTDISPIFTLSKDNPGDEWYFLCLESDNEYFICLSYDDILDAYRVFIDYRSSTAGPSPASSASGLISTKLPASSSRSSTTPACAALSSMKTATSI